MNNPFEAESHLRPDVKDAFTRVKDYVSDFYNSDQANGDEDPLSVMVVVSRDGTQTWCAFDPEFFKDAKGKAHMYDNVIPQAIQDLDAKSVVVLNFAWMVSSAFKTKEDMRDHLTPYTSLKDVPGRMEVAAVFVADDEGRCSTYLAEINRNPSSVSAFDLTGHGIWNGNAIIHEDQEIFCGALPDAVMPVLLHKNDESVADFLSRISRGHSEARESLNSTIAAQIAELAKTTGETKNLMRALASQDDDAVEHCIARIRKKWMAQSGNLNNPVHVEAGRIEI